MFKKILETVEVYYELLFGKAIAKRKLNTIEKCAGFRKAFTLAEVLITLGIIGVVAALTLPTLIQNHQKQTYVTGLKKAYSTLSNAMLHIAREEGVTEWKQLSFVSSNNINPFLILDDSSYLRVDMFQNALAKQMKIAKKDFTYLSNASFTSGADLISTDGTVWFFECGLYFSVDVNGQKGPNKYGRDWFAFWINFDKNRVEPYGATSYIDSTTGEWKQGTGWKLCASDSLQPSCTAKVLIEGKMNY